ncbi:hypothetical protein EJC49_08060 [Aquibium carbonis]|uniref:Uncharacterized protein n=1 Tax=Aquibium carbonis TaxID=2495581 RepID=A0A3R9Y930_9HYPH|nr:hypothetical protein [Aquibium carbonis]RST86864.1 hypothetical protein EJC49_08060 [Aquibium carbonis]
MIEPTSGVRYLLCRPQGGLNDTLVQLELCRRHAARFGRTLIVDLTQSGLRAHFDDVFIPRPNFGAPVIAHGPEIARELDQCASVRPALLAGRISTFVSDWDPGADSYVERESRQPIGFDPECDHPETLLVHDQCGGGRRGFRILDRLMLAPELANTVAARLIPLGADYDAIHVRHTDMSTDYERLFQRCRGLFAGRPLLVCSDSTTVKACAREVFEGSAILSAADIPDVAGRPLHITELTDPRKTTIDLFCDLIAIARSRTFVFTAVMGKAGARPRFSGYSVLAELLHQNPSTIRGLFGAADPDLSAALFKSRSRRFAVPSLGRFLARLDQWRWNLPARHHAARLRFKTRIDVLRSR